ncbi:MAG TPA: cache domain-containing protein [Vicinamibacterales bacterium]|nr:cache domain-containing protein [Vicinamibacterales bacterium]
MSTLASQLRQLPKTAPFLVICGVLVGGGFYLMSFQERQGYLASRDFRLLAVLARQTEDVLNVYAHTPASGNRVASSPTVALETAAQGHTKPTVGLGVNGARTNQRQLSDLLRPVFAPKIDQGAFDTLALATRSGKVVLAAGRREWEIGSMELAALLPNASQLRAPMAEANAAGKSGSSGNSQPVGTAAAGVGEAFDRIAVKDAIVAGVSYKMFIQPCCRDVQTSEGNGTLVVGLVPSAAFREEAMAISPTVVVVASLLIALVVLAWPFLNVALQSARKPLTYFDGLQLGFSATAGLAIATILAVTSMQCARLERDLDGQLALLAEELDQELAAEIAASAEALDRFAGWLSQCPNRRWDDVAYNIQGACRAGSAGAPPESRDFTFAALINSQGQQVRKAQPIESGPPAGSRPRVAPPPLVDVSDRLYFHEALRSSRKASPDSSPDCAGPPCIVQSVVSYTNGEPSAVLARPTGWPEFPVAAMTLRMRSVIRPVLPPGFEFAIIDRNGRVMFHSDVQRNTFEDLFLETDRNPELRSLVSSGVDGGLRTEYWGHPYLAYVRHARSQGWSIVTLFDRRSLRGLMLEWAMVSVLMLVLYFIAWGGMVAAALSAGASWLWPDRFRKRRYAALGVVYLALLIVFGVVVWSPDSTRLLIGVAGFVLPMLACIVTFAVLRRRPAANIRATRLEYTTSYCVPAALLLVITGMVPGAAFVARSYDTHVEAFLKHRQFGIVENWTEIQAHGARLERLPYSAGHLRGWHTGFLYETRICDESVGAKVGACAKGNASGRSTPRGIVAWLAERLARLTEAENGAEGASQHGQRVEARWSLEAFLPYFSEISIRIRELVHSNSDDGSWTSERHGATTILKVPAWRSGGLGQVRIATSVPPIKLSSVLVLLIAGLAGLAYGIALFVTRHVFLGEVFPPLSAVGRLAIGRGMAVLFLCDPVVMARRIRGAENLQLDSLLMTDAQALNQRLQKLDSDAVLLVTGFDDHVKTPEALSASITLLSSAARSSEKAVLVLSGRSRADVAAAAGIAAPKDQGDQPSADDSKAFQAMGIDVLDFQDDAGATKALITVSARPGFLARCLRAFKRIRGASLKDLHLPAAQLHTEALLRTEEKAFAELIPMCDGIRRMDAYRADRLSATEVLEELEERAEELYTKLWNGCRDDEKLELRHIARHGLATYRNRRAVRRLIAKRLVTKDPHLRVMNRTFRHFVLSPPAAVCGPAVEARLEEALPLSAWDRFRVPFAFVVLGVAVFLFLTQRETYNTTIGAVIALSTQVPNVLKAVMMLVQKDVAEPAAQRNV